MKHLQVSVFLEDGTELCEAHARLRAVYGVVLEPGQTPCCYALSPHHPLLRMLGRILAAIPQGGRRFSRPVVARLIGREDVAAEQRPRGEPVRL